ncbi:MAG: TetR/AcrR family transcriptional regulator [Thermodesulfobacteriota bacterium]|nr:TetR/AcrR family transcriptional regulator [Thermodesulfobacteriota bacterium]
MMEKSSFKYLREKEREQRKSIILDAAVFLFKDKVFHKVGMRDIAAKAGISAATIYRYFPSRDDILLEALLQDINAIEKLLDEMMKKETLSIEDLAVAVVDFFLENETTFQMMCYFLTSGAIEEEAMKKFNLIQEYFINMFNMKLKKITSRGGDVFFTQAFFASISGVVLTFLHYPGLSKAKKRNYMHKLAVAIIREGGNLSLGD